MLILQNKRFISAPFDSELEIETAVADNADYLFGPSSIYLPKVLIRSAEGFGTIPDGYVVDLSTKRWFLIEAELASHNVWTHIAPQVSKQLIAAFQPATRRLLMESVVDFYRQNETIRDRFEDLAIEELDIRRVLAEIFEKRPIIGIPIDSIGQDLREWAATLNSEVRLWLVRKLVDFEDPTVVAYELPDEFTPSFDTVSTGPSSPQPNIAEGTQQIRTVYDISIADLVSFGFLERNDTLTMVYGPRGKMKRTFEAHINDDGSVTVDARKFSSISYAAVYCMQEAGSEQKTANGWIYWKNRKGIQLSDLRDQLLESHKGRAAQ